MNNIKIAHDRAFIVAQASNPVTIRHLRTAISAALQARDGICEFLERLHQVPASTLVQLPQPAK